MKNHNHMIAFIAWQQSNLLIKEEEGGQQPILIP